MWVPAVIESDEDITTPIVRRTVPSHALPVLVVTARPALLDTTATTLAGARQPMLAADNAETARRWVLSQRFSGILLDARMATHQEQALFRYRNDWNTDISVALIGDSNDAGRGQMDDGDGEPSSPVDATRPADLLAALERARTNTAQRRLLRQATRLLSCDPRDALQGHVAVPAVIAALQAIDQHFCDDVPTDLLANSIARCAPLLTGTLRLATRLGQRDGVPTGTLKAAIRWFGLVRVRRMAEVVAAQLAFPVREPRFRRALADIWLHGVARAEAMLLLAGRPEVPPVWWFGDIYRAGLFADAGAWFVLWLADQAESTDDGFSVPLPPTLRVIAEHHEWMGEELLRRWCMPEDIAHLAGNHHRRAHRLHLPFWPLALAASDVADEVVDSPERKAGEAVPLGKALDILHLGSEERRLLVEGVRTTVELVQQALGDDRAGDPSDGTNNQAGSGTGMRSVP